MLQFYQIQEQQLYPANWFCGPPPVAKRPNHADSAAVSILLRIARSSLLANSGGWQHLVP
jgi:hypothetical protein